MILYICGMVETVKLHLLNKDWS